MKKVSRKNILKFCEVNESVKDYLDFIRNSRPKSEYEVLDNIKKHMDNISFLLKKIK